MADFIQQSIGAFELAMNASAPLITSVRDTTNRLSHREGSGVITLSGATNNVRGCGCCNRNNGAKYLISFNGNIAVPSTGTAGEIALAFTIDGEPEYTTISKATPTVTAPQANSITFDGQAHELVASGDTTAEFLRHILRFFFILSNEELFFKSDNTVFAAI